MPQRGVGDVFYLAVDIVRANYNIPISGLVESAHQGSGSNTYYLSFRDNRPTVVIQLRQAERALQVENFRSAQKYLGKQVPSARLLAEHEIDEDNIIYAYELTCIPGMPLAMLMRQPLGQAQLLMLSGGLGDLLGRCRTDRSLRDRSGVKQDIFELLQSASQSTERGLIPFKSQCTVLLEQLDMLDNMPLVISNGALDRTNVLVTPEGAVMGLVDWEDLLEYPLGWDLGCLHWLTGYQKDGMFTLRDRYFEVELCFWTSFFSKLKIRITETVLLQVEACMKISAIKKYVSEGRSKYSSNAELLRMELKYAIPRSFVQSY